MANVGIVSDSNCDLTEEVIKKYDIRIVPARIIFGDEEVRRHYVDLSYEEFYHRLVHDKATPSTSIPTPKEYHDVYKEALTKYDEIIVFCTSSKLSSMFNTAQLVQKQLFPENVTVVDTQLITLPLGILVSETAKRASAGVSKGELLSYINDVLMVKTHAFGGIPTLTYLQKGGRIGKTASMMGNLLQVKPIFSIENGEIKQLGKVRGMDKVYNLLFGFAQKMIEKQMLESIIIGHTANPEIATKLAEEMQALPNAPKDIQVIEIGPGVGTHLGPGSLIIAWIGEFDKELLSL